METIFRTRRARVAAFYLLALLTAIPGYSQTLPIISESDIVVVPPEVSIAAATTLFISAHIDDSRVISNSVYVLDASGALAKKLGVLTDTGAGGDPVAGDRWYSGYITVPPPSAGAMLIQITAALAGVIRRAQSDYVLVSAVAHPTTAPAAYLEGTAVVFRSTTGQVVTTIPLQRVERALEIDGETYLESVDYRVSYSPDRSVVGLVEDHSVRPADLPEDAEDQDVGFFGSKFSLYNSNGLLWAVPAPENKDFTLSTSSLTIARQGARVVLLTNAVGGSDPRIEVRDGAGAIIFEADRPLGIVTHAEISSTGENICFVGSADGGYRITVVNLPTQAHAFERANWGQAFYCEETEDGRFAIVVDNVVRRFLPD